MASVNRVIIVGNLGKDPEARYTNSGEAVSNFSVATSERWKDKATGEKKEQTEWHRCGAFGKLAEICNEYLKKGSTVYLEGSIHTRKWKDSDGQERYTTEIKVANLKMLGGKPEGMRDQSSDGDYSPAPAKDKPKPSFDDLEDSIPF